MKNYDLLQRAYTFADDLQYDVLISRTESN